MSRAVHLYRSLSDAAISHLRIDTIPSIPLLSPSHLLALALALALAEKIDDLNSIAATAARLGRGCAHPALLGFEHVYADLLAGRIPDLAALGFLSKDIESTISRMDRLISSTSILYSNLETLTELEHSAKKFPATADARRVLDHKIQWQRHDIKLLRDGSLWNQSFDKAVLLLDRAVCTIHSRICLVFGETAIRLDSLFPKEIKCTITSMPRCRHIPIHSGQIFDNSGPIGLAEPEPEPKHNCSSLRFRCAANPGRLLMDCLSLGRAAAFDNDVCLPQAGSGALPLPFGPKSRLLSLAPPSTVGGSALALHYANVVIIIEKLLRYPHLVGEEARDDLYQMLPSSLWSGSPRSLKAYAKNMSIYDAPLAHDWKDVMEKILCWLAPMAHNMIRWQTERNFEQQQIVFRENVLLLETLYFADRVKTEEAICELLVGLNYVCRYEQQQNALVDCRSSVDFDDCMERKKHKSSKRSKKKVLPSPSPDIETDVGLVVAKKEPLVGPLPLPRTEGHISYGAALRPGEGDAIAQYVQQGKRIPRRGEVGLSTDEISNFENLGYVMSRSRHRRMNAIRIRKENQVFSVVERTVLAMFNYEENAKRDHKVMADLQQLVQRHIGQDTGPSHDPIAPSEAKKGKASVPEELPKRSICSSAIEVSVPARVVSAAGEGAGKKKADSEVEKGKPLFKKNCEPLTDSSTDELFSVPSHSRNESGIQGTNEVVDLTGEVGGLMNSRIRFSAEEKGKSKLVIEKDRWSLGQKEVELDDDRMLVEEVASI